MYRHRTIETVQYGKFDEYVELQRKQNALCREQGWPEAKFFMPAPGAINQFVVEVEYESLSDYEQDSKAALSHDVFMDLERQQSALVIDGSARSELLMSID